MSEGRAFVDTNVLVYLYSNDDHAKRERAYQMLDAYPCMTSVQVMTEFASVCTRKTDMPTHLIDRAMQKIGTRYCYICDVSMDTLSSALGIRERFGYSYYDSIVIASAACHRCSYLFSEDLRDGQMVDGVEIVNIFAREI